MKVTLALAPFYTNLQLPNNSDVLVEKIGAQLGAVEEVIDLSAKYQGAVIVTIISCEDHPNADRLHICLIDDGGVVEGVTREADGYVRVVCGAANVRAGMRVVWLPPGVVVPATFDTEPFVLEARDLRGVISSGMLASSKELGISDDHTGILEVEEEIAPGTTFIDAYHLNDHIIDIENKMFTHRPDCFGALGVYREIAGIFGQAFEGPDWYKKPDAQVFHSQADSQLPLSVHNELPELVPRFMATTMSDVRVKPSPTWLQIHLMRIGIRPINNVVDITNFLMYLTGQPLHAYDYDKVKALSSGEPTLVIRKPRNNEKIALLNGKEIAPHSDAIMIATDRQLIGVGGVMGGSDTEVDDHTTRIILECATFDMYSLRRTSMAHGLFTDAVTRFTKGQSPLQNARVIAKAMNEVRTLAAGTVTHDIIDDVHISEEAIRRDCVHAPVTVTSEFISARLGIRLTVHEIVTLLTNVEFIVTSEDETLHITAPFWRTDIEIPEDIVEEVGRLYGYDHLPVELPRREVAPVAKNPLLEQKSLIRRTLAKAGANEVLTYSFVHGNIVDRSTQPRDRALSLSNALSPDLQYYRLSIVPSLLEKIPLNIRAGYDEFALFELGKRHFLASDARPEAHDMVAGVYAAKDTTNKSGAAFYEARAFVMVIGRALNAEFDLTPMTDLSDDPLYAPFDPARAAYIRIKGTDRPIGIVGELKAKVRNGFKLPQRVAAFELTLDNAQKTTATLPYTPLPRFPKIEQDVCLKVSADLPYARLYELVQRELDTIKPEQTLLSLSPIDIYQRSDDAQHKQITLRLTIASYERTLTDAEVSDLLDRVTKKAQIELGAKRI